MAKAVFNPLTKEQEGAVHLESIKILEEVGIKVTSEKVLKMLEVNGAKVDHRTLIAKLSEQMVRAALAKAPKEFLMCGRDRANDLNLPAEDHVQGVNDGQPTDVWDINTQRSARLQ